MYDLRKIEFYKDLGYSIQLKDEGYIAYEESNKFYVYYYESLDDIYSIFLEYVESTENRVNIVAISFRELLDKGHKHFKLKYIDSEEFLGEH